MKRMTKKEKNMVVGLVFLLAIVGILATGVGRFLPYIGDENSPANSYISKYYLLHAVRDTASPNVVTAVLADYRGFDTLFETCVLFLSGIVTLMTLSTKTKVKKKQRKRKLRLAAHTGGDFGGLVLDASFRLIVPILMIYAIYVLFHGEVSLGGGFQAGALLACAYLLDRVIPSFSGSLGEMKEETALITAGIGTLFYGLVGFVPVLCGGVFMEFGALPFGAANDAHRHATGILLIEIGVTVCVMAVIINILEVVLERTDFDD